MAALQTPIVIYLVWKRVEVACIMGIILLFLETLPVQGSYKYNLKSLNTSEVMNPILEYICSRLP